MAIKTHVIRNRDFSAGELVEHAKRRDDSPIVRAGARQAKNVRIITPGVLKQRPGKLALFEQEGRTDEVRMNSTTTYLLSFGHNGSSGTLAIREEDGTLVGSVQTGYAWTLATVEKIVWTLVNKDVVICYDGNKPKLARWDGASTWTFSDFAWDTASGIGGTATISKEPFYRLAKKGITINPSGMVGSVTVTASEAVFASGMVGSSLRWMGYQLKITGYTSSTQVTCTVAERLPYTATYSVSGGAPLYPGDVVSYGSDKAVVHSVAYSGTTMTSLVAHHYKYGALWGAVVITGPQGQVTLSAGSASADKSSTVWDESVASDYRGWPRSCALDQDRLIFCDYPALPDAITWSGIGSYSDFFVGTREDNATTDASDPIFEIVRGKPRVYHVVGGSDEFIFTDKGVFYTPISVASPLKPGGIEVRSITRDAGCQVRPVETAEGLLYVNAGGNRVVALFGTGQTARPWVTKDVSELHSHLFNSISSIAVTTADGDYAQEYVFVGNGDGSVAVGALSPTKDWIGWVPWTGSGSLQWLSSVGSRLLVTTEYASATLVEELDASSYMDGTVSLNSIPATLPAPVGKGDLWFFAGETVDLMDGLRDLGTRTVDADGNLVTEPNDDFSASTVTVGRAYTVTVEPFVPHWQEGASAQQAMRLRRLSEAAVTVMHSTGFTWGAREIPPYEWGDNAESDPPLREQTYKFRGLGRSYDPRAVLERARPGSLMIVEVSLEVTI